MREIDNLAVEDKKEEIETVKKGKVANCKLLNVRKRPHQKAEILRLIKEGDEVELLHYHSSFEFYKVRLEDGTVGFCMSKFINIES